MKRVLILFALAAACTLGLAAQQSAQRPAEPASQVAEAGREPAGGAGHGDPWIYWKWANFAILVVALGYLIGKYAPPFFRNRTSEIQKGIADAARLRQEAEARAAHMEQRLATLASEVERLKQEARAEMTTEGDRIRNETGQHLARVQLHAEQEIGAAAKAARRDVKAFAAQLAVELAEQRIRARLSADVQNTLVERFVRALETQGSRS